VAELNGEVPEGAVTLRYEFEPAPPPDLAQGKGAGERAQLHIDDRLVGHAEFPATVPLSFGSGGSRRLRYRFERQSRLRLAVSVHGARSGRLRSISQVI
jgi:hypothetical protein